MSRWCALVLLIAGCGRAAQPATPSVAWPPRLDGPYPDLELVDQTGEAVRLSSFKGKVILIEMVGMT